MTKPIDLCSQVQLKNNLFLDKRYDDVFNAITTRIKELPNYQQYRNCIETLLFACNLAENLVLPTDNIDKSAIVIDALTKLFNLSEAEIATTKLNINFLCSHNRVKKFSKYFFWMTRIYKWCVAN